MNKETLKIIEVGNRLTGGVSMDDYDPSECPWCKAHIRDHTSDYDENDWAGIITNYTEWATCASCSKSWAVSYSRVYYQEMDYD